MQHIKHKPKEYELTKHPLSLHFLYLKNINDFDLIMKKIKNKYKYSKIKESSIIITINNNTKIKICGFFNLLSSKLFENSFYIEFDKIEGCPFIFKVIFFEIALLIKDYLLDNDKENNEEIYKGNLKNAKKKLDIWNNKFLIQNF